MSEEEAAHRQLVRDIVGSIDIKSARTSMAPERRRRGDAFVAQGTGGPKPGLYFPASGEKLSCIRLALLQFRADENAGAMRMNHIDHWLSELGCGQDGASGGDGGDGGKRKPAGIPGLDKSAKRTYRSMKHSDGGSHLTIDAASLTKALVSGSLALKDPGFGPHGAGDTKSLLEAINFYKNSIEELISSCLSDKIRKAEAKLVAIELGKLINSYAYNYGPTIEERAKNRELGSRLAGHFAQAFLSGPGEAEAFLERVGDFVRIDEMQEKGYDFWDGQVFESYKPHPLSIVWKRWERGGARPYSRETVAAFEENEKKISETIAKARTKVGDDDVSKRLGQIREVFGIIKDTVDDDDELRTNIKLIGDLNMLWVWYGTDL